MNEKSLISNILDIIDISIAKAGYKVLDGDEECIIVRNSDTNQDFQIKVKELIP